MRTLSLFLLTSITCSAAVTPPEQIQVPPGFKVELLREAGPREGSWICMTQDEQGRLYISPQNAIPESGFGKDSKWGGIWRVTVSDETTKGTKDAKENGNALDSQTKQNPQTTTGAQPGTIRNPQSAIRNWEKVPVPVGDAMGMLWAFDSLYVSGMGPQGRGIYRCKDTDGDGNLDTATLFKAIPGGAGEHGAHAIVLGPDKKLYIVNGNSTGILDGLAPDSPYRHCGEDDLLPRLKDPVATFFDKLKAPYGCVYRTDADGTKWELFAGGFRNPYDLAFNPDGELFTYDSDMEWDRGLPWYRPTRILHVVPGGEYGFREGSAKWPAYFPDSLPAAADIGVGCPTGMKFGTDAKGWPEKYRRALFFHDWTYGRILAVTLHEKGASYTARNDLASYTYPRDAEANGDVEVFLSGKGMPVTDLEFLRDGSMVFTVGGRGTAAALYRVSYVSGAPSGAHRDSAGDPVVSPPATIQSPSGTPATTPKTNAPEAQRNVAGGAASEASATTGSPSAKASAPAGARENAMARAYRRLLESEQIETTVLTDLLQMTDFAGRPHLAAKVRAMKEGDRFTYFAAGRSAETKAPILTTISGSTISESGARDPSNPLFDIGSEFFSFPISRMSGKRDGDVHAAEPPPARPLDGLMELLVFARASEAFMQESLFERLGRFPLASLDDDLKLLHLRVLELSFARQGRPSEERVKALMEELLAHYPVPPIPANAATPARNPAAGAPVDAPAWRLNRELCALLVWLSNPELGALNADLAAPHVEKPKNGTIQKANDRLQTAFVNLPTPFANLPTPSANLPTPFADLQTPSADLQTPSADLQTPSADLQTPSADLRTPSADLQTPFADLQTPSADLQTPSADLQTPSADLQTPSADLQTPSADLQTPSADLQTPFEDGQKGQKGLFLAQNRQNAPPDLPTEAPPVPPSSRPLALNSGLGPVPNPGAAIFPGRKPALFEKEQTELGRQVIEKTLALMDAAPSQEEQVWYALCLRWAHGWTPEQRVRYFRWFHEKAARYSGGNSFAKFVEAIRADAASRVPEADRAALAQWLRPVAAPAPAAALKPRAFVKAWTLPELEAALDKLKDRQPDLARGKDLYTQAQCAQCHLFRDAGGNVGPDLTAVAQRFGRHDILESITDPSKVVSEQYAMVTLTVLDGKGGTLDVSGLVKEETSATITILTDPLAGTTKNLYKNVVVKREKAAVSTMPPGLLYTMTAEEVADLLALFGAK